MTHKLDFFASPFSVSSIRTFNKKKLKLMWRLAVVAIAFALGTLPAFAQSTPIAEDSFDYPTGPLSGKGSASDPGWFEPWSGGVFVTGAPSLMYIDSRGNRLVTHGSRVRTPGFSHRFLETALEYPTYSEVWISFIIDSFNVGIRWSGISLYNSDQELLFMGKPGSSYTLGVQEWPNGHRFPTSDTLSGPVFFVVRIRFNETSTEWTYWLNPDLDETPQDSDAVASDTHNFMTSVNRIRIAGEVPVEFDELRIGTDYSSVAPHFIPTLPAEDSFNYPAGPLNGNGSIADPGWYGSWDGGIRVLDMGSLAYTDTGGRQLVTDGNRVEAPGQSYRELESPLVNFLNPEVWISFLIDDFDWGIRWAGISLYNDFEELLFMGKPGAVYTLGVQEWPNGQRFPTSEALSGPVFFVVRLRFLENNTEWTYWLNPELDETPPDNEAVASDTHVFMYLVNRIRIAGERPIDLDELRVGTDYRSVAPYTEPNQAPFADAGPDQTVYVDEACQAQVTLDGSGSSDPDGDALTYTWENSFGPVDGVNPTVTLGLGTHDITLTVNDGALSDTDTVSIFVEDNTPPSIDSISASPDIIWPPNHKMVPVTISVSVFDNCDTSPTCQIISIISNEPENGLGDGDTAPDWEITGDLTANLRAERAGNGSGRVYTITVRCTDNAGNSTDREVTVTVLHDKKKKK